MKSPLKAYADNVFTYPKSTKDIEKIFIMLSEFQEFSGLTAEPSKCKVAKVRTQMSNEEKVHLEKLV